MLIKILMVLLLAFVILISVGGCAIPDTETVVLSPQATTNPAIDYSALFFTGILPDNFLKTSISIIESSLGQKLPVPIYLPSGYEKKESYRYQQNILILISDQPISWQGKWYSCRMALLIDWGGISGGFKGLNGEVQILPSINTLSVLSKENDEYVLNWEDHSISSDDYIQMTAILRLYTSHEFPKDELVKIADSVPRIVSTIKRPIATGPILTAPASQFPVPITTIPTVSISLVPSPTP